MASESDRATEDVPTAPELFVPDVDAAVDYFTNKLGFAVYRLEKDAGGRATFAVLTIERSAVLIAHESYAMSVAAAPEQPRGHAIDTRIMVSDVDATYERLKRNEVSIVHDIADRGYGLRDFIVQDPLGYRWRFAAPVAVSA